MVLMASTRETTLCCLMSRCWMGRLRSSFFVGISFIGYQRSTLDWSGFYVNFDADSLALQVAVLRNSRLIEQLDGGGRAEIGIVPLAERPDDLLGGSHFENLYSRRPIGGLRVSGDPVADDGVAVGETADLLHVIEREAGEFVLCDLPDGAAPGVDLAHETVLVPADERVSVLEADGVPGRRRGGRPYLLAPAVVLHYFVQVHVGHEEGSGRRHVGSAKMSVNPVGMGRRQVQLFFDLAVGLVDEKKLGGVAVLGEQHAVFAYSLRRMDLRMDGSVIVPHDLLVRRHLACAPSPAEEDVAVRQPGAVAELSLVGLSVDGDVQRDRVAPRHLAIAHQIHGLLRIDVVPLAAIEERMLSKAFARKRRQWRSGSGGSRSRRRRWAGDEKTEEEAKRARGKSRAHG